VAQRPVTVPDGALNQERRDEDRASSHTAPQQPAGPRLSLPGAAGRHHGRSL